VSEEVAAQIRGAIEDHGPITFAEFMELALYAPGGFYQAPPVGTKGHFVTSPHVHPVFVRMVGLGLEVLHAALGRPEPFPIVEVGAGDGTMARELLEGFARANLPVDYVAVEVSPGARAALERLPLRVHERIAEVGRIDHGVVLANELLDNLPFRRLRGAATEPVEVCVGLGRDGFVEVQTPCPPELAEDAGGLRDGEEALVPVGVLAFVDELASALACGYALLIDYGSAGGHAGAVHGYRDHRALGDVLREPGTADITAGVDLAVVARRARERGLRAFEPVPQWAALVALGFEDWSRSELEHQRNLLAAERGAEAVRAWGGRSRASLLVDPAGLGSLLWLVLSTAELDEPGWLAAAREARTY
jgi:SAM-dependent MidA family methyltransferase